MSSSQRLPQIMCVWERIHNFIILKKYASLRVKYVRMHCNVSGIILSLYHFLQVAMIKLNTDV